MNNLISNVQIMEDPEYGVILVCRNLELADQFEDFLTEKHSVLFHIKLEPNQVSFFFGKTNTTSEVKELFNQFMLSS
ncbi:hypothetical protein HUN28_15970 [Acinetobacter oleivorans]|uniref:hypothetical protein n=1 Tax=Acinetobacter oleivorans TaxID=1148157 RepID=UPI001580DA37|nr:hypothetical protein [Acinetobacter oleivorans]NUF31680.1 hypothetical protein [Acinetobacter oleivorans]